MKCLNPLAKVVLLGCLCTPIEAHANAVCGDSVTCSSSPAFNVNNSNSTGLGISTNSTWSYGLNTWGKSNGIVVSAGPASSKGVWAYNAVGPAAVYASTSGSAIQVAIYASGNTFGVSATGKTGVHANAYTGSGVVGKTTGAGASGVYGESDVSNSVSSNAVLGRVCGNTGSCVAGPGIAIYGDNNSTANGAWAGYFNGQAYVTGTYSCTSSDVRLKKNIHPIVRGVDLVSSLHGVTFEWKEPEKHTGPGTHWGFIAQEVEKVYPQWVTDDTGTKMVDYRQVTPMLVEAVKELEVKNRVLRSELKTFEARQRPAVAGLNSNGFFGLAGLLTLGASLIWSRRRGGSVSAERSEANREDWT